MIGQPSVGRQERWTIYDALSPLNHVGEWGKIILVCNHNPLNKNIIKDDNYVLEFMQQSDKLCCKPHLWQGKCLTKR